MGPEAVPEAPSPPPGSLAAFQAADPSAWASPQADSRVLAPRASENHAQDPLQQQQQQSSCSDPAEGTFHPFKAQAYWFGGVDPTDVQTQEAAAWTASGDMTHKVTAYHVGEDIAAARQPPPPDPAAREVSAVTMTVPILDAPTVSSALKSGRLSPTELEQQIAARHGGVHEHERPWSAPRSSSRMNAASGQQQQQQQQQSLLAASPFGASLGSTLKGSVAPVGSGALRPEQEVSGRGSMRPMSARSSGYGNRGRSGADASSFWGGAAAAGSGGGSPAGASFSRPMSASARLPYGHGHGAHQTASFSAVANSQGGPKMEMLHRQMNKSDIAAVRALY